MRDLLDKFRTWTPLTDEEQRLSYLAHHDQLTNLPNRHHLTAMLPEALADASAKGEMLAIMCAPPAGRCGRRRHRGIAAAATGLPSVPEELGPG